jgi:hypothetical protein
MSYICFSNAGEIDPRLITVMGTNVKAHADAIGTFGTGLKYAIAIVLRLKGEITIHTGKGVLTFDIVRDSIRGKEFEFILMNGHGSEACAADDRILGFTTELGKLWQPWMAYRELYCNARDELGCAKLVEEIGEPKAGFTRIYVDCEELLATHNAPESWLLPDNMAPLEANSAFQAYPSLGNGAYYYRGIKVGKFSNAPMFTYNILQHMNLTEDRTLSEHQVDFAIKYGALEHSASKAFLKRLFLASKEEGIHEAAFRYEPWYTPNPIALDVLRELRQTKRALLSPSLNAIAEQYLPQEDPTAVALTRLQQATFDRACGFLTKLGFHLQHEVVFVETLGSQWISGLAQKERIYIPISTFGKGTKFLASTLLEEHLHLTQGLADESRELQDWLFDKVVSMGEELLGEPL